MSDQRRSRAQDRARRLRTDLRRCTIDGFFYCVMLGLAEMYLAKFVSALGLGAVPTGLIATVPMVLGACFGIPGQWLLRRMGSYPRFIGGLAGLQAVMLVPLAAIAFTAPRFLPALRERNLEWVATILVFSVTTLYFAGSLGGGPAWTTITASIIPPRIRANYFALRSRLLQAGTFGGLLAHGLISDQVERAWNSSPRLAATGLDPVLCACGITFLLAAACRAVSSYHLSRYTEPAEPPSAQQQVRAIDFVRRFNHGNDGRFFLYALAGGLGQQIAQPFFNPFMLQQLRATGSLHTFVVGTLGRHAPYTLLLAAVYLGRVLALPWAGRLAARAGGVRLLWVGGLMLPPMAVFWLFTPDFGVLLLFQIATGAALAIWELGVFLMNYESVEPGERMAMITYYTVSNEASKTSGSLIGGALLDSGAGHAYPLVFWTSAAARVVTLVLLARVRPPTSPPPHGRADIAAAEEGTRLTVE